MTRKIGIYNGGTESYKFSDKPDDLIVGGIYTIVKQHKTDYQTNYELAEFPGKEFNSCWFNEPTCYIAVAYTHPKIGEKFYCNRYDMEHKSYGFHSVTTSKVTDITKLGNNIYLVKTKNSMYFCEIH